ncbi:N-acetylmuramoyl-L-alanine amidase family protein [Terrisporobacter sp.]
MKVYKISLIVIIIIGIVFIGTSSPMQNLYKSSAFIIGNLDNNKSPTKTKNKDKKVEKYLICIDPGHQSKGDSKMEPVGPGSPYQKARVSSGTVGISTKKPEYILNLEASEVLKHILISKGYEVIMTRNNHDVNISNMERATFANNKNANMVIRIHADGSDDTSITGASILIPSQKGKYTSSIFEASYKCANLVKSKMDGAGFKVNGIFERDDLTGFNWSTVPVILVEMGFMSNYNEDEMMSNANYQRKMMQSIADGVEEYFQIN